MSELVPSLKIDDLAGDLDAYTKLLPKLKMGTIEDEFSRKTSLSSPQSRQGVPEMDGTGQVKTGKCFTLRDAIESLLPEFSGDRFQTSEEVGEERTMGESEAAAGSPPETSEIKLVRIQGIEMKLEIPFSWVVNNLMNPEFYLHISVLVKAAQK